MASFNWPVSGGGSPYWGDSVATLGSLPPSGSVVGEARLVRDTNDIYSWNGSSWERITENLADVQGPVLATNDALARFDGTSGKLIQNSVVTLDDSGNLAGVTSLNTITATEIGYLDNVTSNIQTQINGKEPTINLTINRAVQSNGSGGIAVSATTATELGFVSGVTSAIQTQINTKVNRAGDTMTGVLVLSADPSNSLDAATKQYVDAAINGVQVKAGVEAATTANITLSGPQTIDGISVTAGQRVLVKNQSTQTQNGIYLVAAGAWTRTTDADTGAELHAALVTVKDGTINANTGWYQISDNVTIGVTNIVFNQFFGAGTYTADGQGIELSGSTFSLELDGATLSKSASGLKVADLGVANAQVATAAAIALTKLAATTVSRALVSDGSGFIAPATTTAAEIGFVNGVTSSIQTQINSVLAATSVATIASSTTLSNKVIALVDTTTARTLTLPAPAAGLYIPIKDKSGSAQTNNITLTPASGTIDGEASYVIDANYRAVTVVSDGTNYFVI